MNKKIEEYKRVVILQSQLQIKFYLNFDIQKNDLIIPIGPEAIHFVEYKNIPHIKLIELLNKEDYENFKIISIKKIDELVENMNLLSAKYNLDLGTYFSFQFNVIIGQIHYSYFLAKSIKDKFYNKQILLYYNNARNTIIYEFRPDRLNNLYNVFNNLNFNNSMNIISKGLEEPNINIGLRNKILSLFNHNLINMLRRVINITKIFGFKRKNGAKLLLIGGGYDWLRIAKNKNFNHNISIFKNKRSTMNTYLSSEIYILLNKSIKFDEICIFNINEFSKIVAKHFFYFKNNICQDVKYIKKYTAIISSVFTFPFEIYLAHIATKINKPVIVWQHGEKGQSNDPTIFSTELCYATNYFTYSIGVKEYYNSFIEKNFLKSVDVVGTLTKNVKWLNGNKILYATGKWFYTAASVPILIDPDYRQYNAQNKILSYLNNKPDVILKANNTRGFNNIPFNYSNININYKDKFTDLLSNSRIVILDTPATTLVEACSTRIPIFVLGGRNIYFDKFLNLVKKRVVWREDVNDLIFEINLFLENGIYNSDLYNDEYYNTYCTSLNTNVVDNINNALNNILKNKK